MSNTPIAYWSDQPNTAQMEILTDHAEIEQRQRRDLEELKADLIPIGNQLVQLTINELADIAMDIAGKKLEKEYQLDKPQGVRGRNSDNTLVKEILGWVPSTSLRDGMSKTYPWIAGQVEKVRG